MHITYRRQCRKHIMLIIYYSAGTLHSAGTLPVAHSLPGIHFFLPNFSNAIFYKTIKDIDFGPKDEK